MLSRVLIILETIESQETLDRLWWWENVLCGTILRQKRDRCSWKQWRETNHCFILISPSFFALVDFIMLLNHNGIKIHFVRHRKSIIFGPHCSGLSLHQEMGRERYTIPKDHSHIHCIYFRDEGRLGQLILKWKEVAREENLMVSRLNMVVFLHTRRRENPESYLAPRLLEYTVKLYDSFCL